MSDLDKRRQWIHTVLMGEYVHISTQEIEDMIQSIRYSACMVSNTLQPWKDNVYGPVATALSGCLPTDHTWHPRNGGIWGGLDAEK